MSSLLLCLVLFCLVFLICLIYAIFFSSTPRENFGKVNLENLKTGDVLLLSGKTIPERIICFLTGSEFSHCAMVLKHKDKTLLWEADIGQGKKKGPRIIEIGEKLNRYKGHRTAAIVRIKKEIPLRKILGSAERQFDRPMDECMFAYFLGRHTKDNSVFCSELLFQTLKDAGVLKKKETARGVAPSLFLDGLEGMYEKPEFFSW